MKNVVCSRKRSSVGFGLNLVSLTGTEVVIPGTLLLYRALLLGNVEIEGKFDKSFQAYVSHLVAL